MDIAGGSQRATSNWRWSQGGHVSRPWYTKGTMEGPMEDNNFEAKYEAGLMEDVDFEANFEKL